jgi:PAS domain-containing protein
MWTAPDGSTLDANPAACRMMGRRHEKILVKGRGGDGSIPPIPNLAVWVAERVPTGQSSGRAQSATERRSLFSIEISSVVLQGPAGEPRTCILIRDIREARATEAERQRLIDERQEALRRDKSLSTGYYPGVLRAGRSAIRDQRGS